MDFSLAKCRPHGSESDQTRSRSLQLGVSRRADGGGGAGARGAEIEVSAARRPLRAALGPTAKVSVVFNPGAGELLKQVSLAAEAAKRTGPLDQFSRAELGHIPMSGVTVPSPTPDSQWEGLKTYVFNTSHFCADVFALPIIV